MKLLGISSATETLSLCITDGEKLVERSSSSKLRAHAELIVPMISDLFNKANLSLKNIDGIAINLGPGSFTGLRVGLSTAKGIAFGSGLKIFGHNSFEEYLYQAIHVHNVAGLVSIIIDSRIGEFYFAQYSVDGQNFCLNGEYELLNLDEVISKSKQCNYSIVLNSSKYKQQFQDLVVNLVTFDSDSYYGCLLVNGNPKKYKIDNYDYLEPKYLKEFIPK